MSVGNAVVTIDDENNIVRIKLTGYLSLGSIEKYSDDRSHAIELLLAKGLESNSLGIIIDANEFAIQSQEITQRLAAMPLTDRDRDIHVAVIIKSALAQMQAKRLVPDRYHFFQTEADAMAWLKAVRG